MKIITSMKVSVLSMMLAACTPVMAQDVVEDVVEQLDPLKQALADTISKVTAATGEAVDFLQAEIPEVIRQLLMWKGVESFLWFVISILSIPSAAYCVAKFCKNIKDFEAAPYSEGGHYIPRIIILAIAGIICLASVFVNFEITWLQIWLAPKVYLIEYASTFL